MKALFRAGSSALAALALASLLPGAAAAETLPTYGPPQLIRQAPETGGAQNLDLADFTGDGLVDIVLTRDNFATSDTFPVEVLLSDGRGGLVDGTSMVIAGAVPRVQQAVKILVADFNGDGRPDLFFADFGRDFAGAPDQAPPEAFNGRQNTLLLSTADGRLVDATANLPQQTDSSTFACGADVDGDGDLDIYVANIGGRSQLRPTLLLNDGAGRFTRAEGRLPDFLAATGLHPFAICQFVDVDGDGAPDLVLGAVDIELGPSLVLLNDGTGRFSTPPLPLPGPIAAFAPHGTISDIALLDLDRDGIPDLLVAFSHGTPQAFTGRYIQVLIGNGDGTFRDETATRFPGQADNTAGFVVFFRLVDIDGDGRLDLELITGNVGCVQPPIFFRDDGHGVFVPLADDFGHVATCAFHVPVDLDGDGGRDFFFVLGAAAGNPEFQQIARDIGPVLPPGVPTDVSTSRGLFSDKVRVSWRHVWGATSYEVWRSTRPDAPATRIATTRGTMHDDTTAVHGLTYHYSVKAVNAAATSAGSVPAPGFATTGRPRVELTTNGETFRAGERLEVGIEVQNPSTGGVPLDLYAGALLPDGRTLVFLSSAGAPSAGADIGSPARFSRMRLVPRGTAVSRPAFLRFTVPATGVPAGSYRLFAALVERGALADGRIDPGDLLAIDVKTVTLAP